MMADWNGYRRQLIETIGKIAQLSPDTVRGYSVLGAAGSKTKHLDPKMRELIALAVAVTLRCDGCITVHTDAAMNRELKCVLVRRSRSPYLIIYGVGTGNEPPKMSLLPKVAGQSCCGAGWATEPPDCTEVRQLSIAGQSAAFRTSFQTAAP